MLEPEQESIQLQRELGETKRELDEVKHAKAEHAKRAGECARDYKAKIQGLMAEREMLVTTLDDTKRTLEATHTANKALHQQISRLTNELQEHQQLVTKWTSVETKRYQEEMAKLILESKILRRQVIC
ncbi:hypothetical protein BGX24_003454 [Mortierella sp. AD032]|nr:hypothetical protein BGX24_003454 [Mortierella sp. AD032]